MEAHGDRSAVLEARGVTKRFGSVVANDGVTFTLLTGEIHALLGENGAGKSTLMHVLYGLYQPDEGAIVLRGVPVRFRGPHDAIAHGIGMVHQHFMLVPTLSVAENIILGNETPPGDGSHGWRLDLRAAGVRIGDLAQRLGLPLDPGANVGDLSVGMQQRVEIVKAFYRGAEILILDEPTAVLTPQEADELGRVMRQLTAQGTSIIFISHKLREVLSVADRISVLRGGKVVGYADDPRAATEASLAAMMVGRTVLLQIEKGPAHPGADALVADGLKALDDRGAPALDGASLTVRAGEIVGVAGVEGNGQVELAEVLTGLRIATAGRATLGHVSLLRSSPRHIAELGTAYVPGDRQRFGLVLADSVADNLILKSYYRRPFAVGLTLSRTVIARFARELVTRFDVRTASVEQPVSALSGGNQQKVVVARELSGDNHLLIVVQPTRGLDVGSVEAIHRHLVEQRDAGVAVLLISSELDEIMNFSDRIAVMYQGRVVATVDAATTPREKLGLLMAGVVSTEVVSHA